MAFKKKPPGHPEAVWPSELEQVVPAQFVLKLYITGSTPRSLKALTNIRTLCEQHLAGQYELEIVDLYAQPEKAREAQVLASPTLIKDSPPPRRMLLGDMSDHPQVLESLDVPESKRKRRS